MGIKEEEYHSEDIENIFNKVIEENFSNLERVAHPSITSLQNVK